MTFHRKLNIIKDQSYLKQCIESFQNLEKFQGFSRQSWPKLTWIDPIFFSLKANQLGLKFGLYPNFDLSEGRPDLIWPDVDDPDGTAQPNCIQEWANPVRLAQWFGLVTLVHTKGQLISKADWHAIDSPKKQMEEFVWFVFLLFTENKSNLSFILWLTKLKTTQPNWS